MWIISSESKDAEGQALNQLITMQHLAALLIRLGQPERAKQLAEECVRGNVARFGPDHSETRMVAGEGQE